MLEDNIYNFVNWYQALPSVARYPAGWIYKNIPYRVRYGKTFAQYSKLLKHSPGWDDLQKEHFTIKQLRHSLINAFENTVYYNKLFNKVDFNPYNFGSVNEIQKIPFSDKEILRANKSALINKNYSQKDLLYVTTSGTSGIPIELYYRKGIERSREFAFMTNQWERIGYKKNDRIARLRGTVVDNSGNNTYFKYEPIKNRLFLSTYDLYESNFPLYVEKLKEFKPQFIHSYPSALILLAKYLIYENIQFKGLKGILCSSEQFYPGQRELIEQAFKTRVFSWYGHTEGTTLAGECEHSSNYHLYFEYGFTELIDKKGLPITSPGVSGEIVGTSFEMQGFPIIRYRTGDFAEFVGEKCRCGRNYTLINNVKGRWLQENIITNKNSQISITALNMHTNIFDNVIQYQFYQNKPGFVIIQILKGVNYSSRDEELILREFQKKFKDLVDVKINYVDRIERTNRGKHKFLVQEIIN